MDLYDVSRDGNDPYLFSEEEHQDIVFFITHIPYLQLLLLG